MCGIVGSLDSNLAVSIAEKMRYRGTRAWSMQIVNLRNMTTCMGYQENEYFDPNRARDAVDIWYKATDDGVEPYFIFHLLSPTGTGGNYHPAMAGQYLLWHNGMMDTRAHKEAGRGWDTQIFVNRMDESTLSEAASEFRGSFAAFVLHLGLGLWAGRNRISPLFSNGKHTYASIEYDDSFHAVSPGTFYAIPGSEITARDVGFANDYNPFGV